MSLLLTSLAWLAMAALAVMALGIVLLAFALPLTGVLAWLQGAPRVLRRQPA